MPRPVIISYKPYRNSEQAKFFLESLNHTMKMNGDEEQEINRSIGSTEIPIHVNSKKLKRKKPINTSLELRAEFGWYGIKVNDIVWNRFISGCSQRGFVTAMENTLSFYAASHIKNKPDILQKSHHFKVSQQGKNIIVEELVYIYDILTMSDEGHPRNRKGEQVDRLEPSKHAKPILTISTKYKVSQSLCHKQAVVNVTSCKLTKHQNINYLPDYRSKLNKLLDWIKHFFRRIAINTKIIEDDKPKHKMHKKNPVVVPL